MDRYYLKQMTIEDLPKLDETMKLGGFNWGVQNWLYCFRASPETFYFIVEKRDREIAGVYTENRMTKTFCYGHAMVILPKYRNTGAMNQIYRRLCQSEMIDVNNLADNKSGYVMRHTQMSFAAGHKIVEFGGRVMGHKSHFNNVPLQLSIDYDDFTLNFISNESDLNHLVEYDSSLYSKIDLITKARKRFIKEWAFNDCATSILALDRRSGVSLGFGTIVKVPVNQQSGKFKYLLCPVYAENDRVGESILDNLYAVAPENKFVYFQFPAENRISMEFCRKNKMTFLDAEFRTYTKTVLKLPLKHIFSSHDFWPF